MEPRKPRSGEEEITQPEVRDTEGETLAGRVKWFDAVKGYGFITPDDGGGDILVHYNLLGQMGRKSLPEGARVTLTAREGARGRQAVSILELDLSSAIGPDPDRSAERSAHRVEPLDFLAEAGDFEAVQVRWFNRAKGYGFLLRNDGVTQAFIHMETVRRGGFENLLPGQSVEARIHDGPRGALAVVVRAAVPPSL
ncbi:cold-shock protein [Sandaracinobacteroides sayramensis]|uniref:cold-shock protein n=1 Tax=Sandaracinobacteroides sayramensis TaxID=2913411 RepID=UPI00234307E5|nr:cold shock domain-containing protein [Sandaracinobacteroides sayramensis]